jgi:hypothetical protein
MTRDRERLSYLGSLGGRALLAKRGRQWMARIGQRGGLKTAQYSYEQRRAWGALGPLAKEKRNVSGV